MKKAVLITGLISTIMIVLGALFKIQHWPGAGPLIVFGVMIHVLAFLPLWMIFRVRETQGGLGKAVVVAEFLVLFVFYIGILFKVQHWPGASPFIVLSVLLAAFVFTPLLLINFKKERERQLWFLPTLFIVAPVIMIMLAKNIGRSALDSFISVDHSLSGLSMQINSNSEIFYEKVRALESMDPGKMKPVYEKALKLRKVSDELHEYIYDLRSHLVSNVQMVEPEVADTLKVADMYHRDNYDIPTWILIGSDPANPSEGRFSAGELKSKIEAYREMLIELIGNREATKNIGLSTTGKAMEGYGVIESWETSRFYSLPLGAVVNALDALDIEVRNAELTAIHELSSQAAELLPVRTIEP